MVAYVIIYLLRQMAAHIKYTNQYTKKHTIHSIKGHRADHYIFALWFLSIFFFFYSSPNLSGRRLDVYHTSTHGVALVRI